MDIELTLNILAGLFIGLLIPLLVWKFWVRKVLERKVQATIKASLKESDDQ